MNKKLTAKIQKLTPVLGENENTFSSSIAIEPPEKELVLKKGSVYATFDVSSPVPLNVSLISRVVNDVLYDSYYHSENISPIQSLEKAIVTINDKVSNLIAQAVSTQPPNTKQEGSSGFNMVAGVLWGNVLYMVQYGNGKSFLMREGEIKEVSSTSEGNFSVASGVVKNGDVIILNTEAFANKYPPEKLLDASLSSNDLETSFASIILKFSVDEEFSENEQIDFGVKADKKMGKLKGVFQGSKDKSKDEPIESLVDPDPKGPQQPAHQNTVQPSPGFEEKYQIKQGPSLPANEPVIPSPAMPEQQTQSILPKQTPPQEAQPQTVSPIVDDEKPKIKPKKKLRSKKESPNIKLRSKRGRSKVNIKNLTIVVSVLLVFSVFVTLLVRNNKSNSDQQNQEQGERSSLFVPREFNNNEEQQAQQQEPKEQEPAKPAEEEPNLDIQNKVARVDAQPFYDIKLADETAQPKEIAVFPNTLVVTDPVSGKIFTSSTSTPKFVAEEQAFTGIKTTENYEGNLNFADDEGYKVYNLGSSTVENNYDVSTSLASRYLGNIYSVESGSIIKYTISGDSAESSTWAEDPSILTNAKDIVVSYSIYVATAQNELAVYTSGEKSNFSLSGLDKPLSNLISMAANQNYENIYLADAGNNRVVVTDNEGNFVKQIKAEEEGSWSDIKSIDVNADESVLYILSGSKVYEVDLTQANPPQLAGPTEPEPEVVEGTEEIINADETTDVIETEGTADQS